MKKDVNPMELDRDAHIHLIEDDFPIRSLIINFLSSQNFHMTTSENGRDALDDLKRLCPSLIITDYNMPFINGVETTKRFRKYPSLIHVPVLLLSSHPFSDKEIEEFEESGITCYMPKPFVLDHLLATIKELLISHSLPVGQL